MSGSIFRRGRLSSSGMGGSVGSEYPPDFGFASIVGILHKPVNTDINNWRFHLSFLLHIWFTVISCIIGYGLRGNALALGMIFILALASICCSFNFITLDHIEKALPHLRKSSKIYTGLILFLRNYAVYGICMYWFATMSH